jgi:hypothetical protein
MYSFPLCISCIWHGICNVMYRHPCILDCMHFISYALGRKSFSYIHCSPWNDIYGFVSLLGMIWLVWLSSWKSWFISMVDGYVFWKLSHECSLVSQCLYMILTCLDSLFWSYGAKGSFAIMNVYPSCFILWRGISSFLSQRHFMYQIWIWKWKVNCLENVLPFHRC